MEEVFDYSATKGVSEAYSERKIPIKIILSEDYYDLYKCRDDAGNIKKDIEVKYQVKIPDFFDAAVERSKDKEKLDYQIFINDIRKDKGTLELREKEEFQKKVQILFYEVLNSLYNQKGEKWIESILSGLFPNENDSEFKNKSVEEYEPLNAGKKDKTRNDSKKAIIFKRSKKSLELPAKYKRLINAAKVSTIFKLLPEVELDKSLEEYPSAVLTDIKTTLNEVLSKLEQSIFISLSEFLDMQEVVNLLQKYCKKEYEKDSFSFGLIPHIQPLTNIVRALAAERVPLDQFSKIYQIYRQYYDHYKGQSLPIGEIIKEIRKMREIKIELWGNDKAYKSNKPYEKIIIEEESEKKIKSYFKKICGYNCLVINEEEKKEILDNIEEALDKIETKALVVKDEDFRPLLRRMIADRLPEVPVLAEAELIEDLPDDPKTIYLTKKQQYEDKVKT